MPSPSRREFLLGMAVTPIALSLSCSNASGPTAARLDERRLRPLPIPRLADSAVDRDETRTFTLRAAPGMTPMVAGISTATWDYNGSVLGPTPCARNGETVSVQFARCNGGPHQTIQPGARWQPTWTVSQPAATLWYHPHPHGETEKHVYRGLAGLFIVDDDNPTVDLPNDYGVDDIPLIIQDRRFTATGALDESDSTDVGMLGDTIITNGIAS